MTINDLTFNPDNWNIDLERHVGFTAEHIFENGYRLQVFAEPVDTETPLNAWTDANTYSIIVYTPEHSDEIESIYSTSNENHVSGVNTTLSNIEALTPPAPSVESSTTTTSTTAAPQQWD